MIILLPAVLYFVHHHLSEDDGAFLLYTSYTTWDSCAQYRFLNALNFLRLFSQKIVSTSRTKDWHFSAGPRHLLRFVFFELS
jgi:hypothetical protein